MKERIKEVATDMLIAHGSSGFRFQQIAQALDCTRGNIHYHYRHKHELVEDVTIEYCQRTIGHFDQIWLSDSTLSQKIQLSMQFNEMRYLKRNPQGDTSHPWSLIARMRLESALITPAAREALARYSHELQRSVVAGCAARSKRASCGPIPRWKWWPCPSSRWPTAPIRSPATRAVSTVCARCTRPSTG